MTLDLALIFTILMGVAILAYVVLDGYDLGVGILLPLADEREQNVMVSSIGPFWDANETWLVLGIGVLLVAFPIAHGLVLTSLYLPVLVMLVGLILRGVAFEFRVKAEGWHRDLWNWFFWFGSVVAAFAQGVMLGLYIVGFQLGAPYLVFAFITGLGVCGGYVLLGATWLIWRTDGPLQDKAISWTGWGLVGVAIALVLVGIATPLESPTIRAKWFQLPGFMIIGVLPILMIACGLWIWRSSHGVRAHSEPRDWKPFVGAVLIYVLAFGGLAYSLFPYIVMDRLTVWEAAAHPSSLIFMLVGAAIVLPMIILYSAYSYWVFRGKAEEQLYG